jgi:hypothetical protein
MTVNEVVYKSSDVGTNLNKHTLFESCEETNRSGPSEKQDLLGGCSLEIAENAKTHISQTITSASTSEDKEKRSLSARTPIAESCPEVGKEKLEAVGYRKGKDNPFFGGILFEGRSMKKHFGVGSQTSRNCSWCWKEVMCRTCASCKEPFCGVCNDHTPCSPSLDGS